MVMMMVMMMRSGAGEMEVGRVGAEAEVPCGARGWGDDSLRVGKGLGWLCSLGVGRVVASRATAPKAGGQGGPAGETTERRREEGRVGGGAERKARNGIMNSWRLLRIRSCLPKQRGNLLCC